jgi:Cft2 family RNA processing exonuclease
VTGSKHLINTGDLQVHCGWIPRLYKAGYRGKVYATPATIDLCGVILPDSGHLQEEEADFHNRRHFSQFFGHGNVLSFDRCKSPMFNESPNESRAQTGVRRRLKK